MDLCMANKGSPADVKVLRFWEEIHDLILLAKCITLGDIYSTGALGSKNCRYSSSDAT